MPQTGPVPAPRPRPPGRQRRTSRRATIPDARGRSGLAGTKTGKPATGVWPEGVGVAAVGSYQGAAVDAARDHSPPCTSPHSTSPHSTSPHSTSPHSTSPHDAAERDLVLTMVEAARRRLDADLCFLARGRGAVQVLDVWDGDADSFGVGPGSLVSFASRHDPRRVHTGSVDLGAAASMRDRPYLGVSVAGPNGEIHGTLCWLSHGVPAPVGEAEYEFVTLLATALAHTIGDRRDSGHDRDDVRQRFLRLIEAGGPAMTYQPVFDLPTLDCMGAEALARFPPGFGNVQQCFADAAAVGLGTELELAAIDSALRVLPDLPGEFGLGVNASPATILSGRLRKVIANVPADRVVLEVTEHDRIDDWTSMRSALDALRAEGVRIAVDDVGVGYAGLQQLIQLLPEFVKMDRCLTRGIDNDPARRALAAALVHFAEDIDGLVLAEGVETAAELGVIVGAGVHQAQGRYLAPPGPLPLPPSANRLTPAG